MPNEPFTVYLRKGKLCLFLASYLIYHFTVSVVNNHTETSSVVLQPFCLFCPFCLVLGLPLGGVRSFWLLLHPTSIDRSGNNTAASAAPGRCPQRQAPAAGRVLAVLQPHESCLSLSPFPPGAVSSGRARLDTQKNFLPF